MTSELSIVNENLAVAVISSLTGWRGLVFAALIAAVLGCILASVCAGANRTSPSVRVLVLPSGARVSVPRYGSHRF